MTINRTTDIRKGAKVEAFVNSAPPGANRAGVLRGRKEQITLTIAPELLGKIEDLARRTGQSRAALINRAIYELAERVV